MKGAKYTGLACMGLSIFMMGCSGTPKNPLLKNTSEAGRMGASIFLFNTSITAIENLNKGKEDKLRTTAYQLCMDSHAGVGAKVEDLSQCDAIYAEMSKVAHQTSSAYDKVSNAHVSDTDMWLELRSKYDALLGQKLRHDFLDIHLTTE